MARVPSSISRLAACCCALAGGAGALAIALGAGGPPPAAQPGAHAEAEQMPLVFAYYLPNCPVMDEEIEAGHAVVHEVQGREVRFCCDGCIEDFDRHPEAGFKAIDQTMIEDQLPWYPMTTCMVSGEELNNDDAVNVVYKNRLVRFCCQGCVSKFEADPEKFLHELDANVAAAQAPDYPLEECVVAGHAIADGEHPTQVVIGGRLIRLCCQDCMEELLRDPAKYVKMVDDAWEAQHAAHDGHAPDHAAPHAAPHAAGGHAGHGGH